MDAVSTSNKNINLNDENIDWFYGAKKEEKGDDQGGKRSVADEINDQKRNTSNHLLVTAFNSERINTLWFI